MRSGDNDRTPTPHRKWIGVALLLLGSSTWACSMSAEAQDPARSQAHGDSDFEDFLDLDAESPQVWDPLEPVNRGVFLFNDGLYTWVLDPVARTYRFLVPEPVRVGIGNVLDNAATPVRLANDLLQFDLDKAKMELGRFAVNTTWGLGGLFDPADTRLGWEAPAVEDFGQTLAHHGVGEGVPLMLPLVGPSNLRDAIGMVPDFFLHPSTYLLDSTERTILTAGDTVNTTSLRIGAYESAKGDALDPYTLFRDAYLQNRRKEVAR